MTTDSAEENLLLCHSLWKPCLKKKKKKVAQRYMCSFSGIITGHLDLDLAFDSR